MDARVAEDDEPPRREGTIKKRMPFRSLVSAMPRRTKAFSAAGRTFPQKKRETETRISPEVCFSAELDGRLDPFRIDDFDELAPMHEAVIDLLLAFTSRPKRLRRPSGRRRR